MISGTLIKSKTIGGNLCTLNLLHGTEIMPSLIISTKIELALFPVVANVNFGHTYP